MFNSLKRIKNLKSVIKMFHSINKQPMKSMYISPFNKTIFRKFSETKNEEKKQEEYRKEEENNNEEESQNVNFKTSRKVQRLIFLILKIMFYAGSLVTFLNIWVYAKYSKPEESPLYNNHGYNIVKYIHLSGKSITDVT
jgi:hypothetical protein